MKEDNKQKPVVKKNIITLVIVFFVGIILVGLLLINFREEEIEVNKIDQVIEVLENPVETKSDSIPEKVEETVIFEDKSEDQSALIAVESTQDEFTDKTLPALFLLKPYIPENSDAKLILKSIPIPGKPIIAIYRVREGDSPIEPGKIDPTVPVEPAPVKQPVIKPEPTIAITPEPTVVPEPTPVTEPDNVVTAVPADPDPITQPEIVQTPTIIVEPIPEPIIAITPELTPVLEPDNVATAVPAEPEIEKTPLVIVEPEPIPESVPVIEPDNVRAPLAGAQEQTQQVPIDTAPPHIAILSPTTGTFYTKKIQIEGQISSSADNLNSVHGVGRVTWEIAGKKPQEELFFGSDGVFFLSFTAKEYTGTLEIIIKAEKEGGDSGEYKLTLFDGNVSPELTIDSPVEGGSYGAAIRISGRVTDPSAIDINLTGPESLTYSLFSLDSSSSDKQISGTIPVGSDGKFSAIIFSNDFTGEQLVTITAHGRNGKTSENSVSIVESDSDIPGFSVVQEDGIVRLSWDSLPGVEEYNLFYADAGTDPAGINGNKFSDVKSPLQIKNLREGFLYRFQLEAVPLADGSTDEKNYWSNIKETILLTFNTLKPVAASGYQQISLVWLNIPGTKKFDILRKESSTGSYQILEDSFEGTSYVDRDVIFGKQYSYKIRPSMDGGQLSSSVSLESLPFPEEKTVVMTGYGSSGLQGIEVVGSYIFLANGTRGIKIIDNADSLHPLEVGRYPSDDAKDILIRGERAYIADGYRGIKILDINDPGNPILLGSRKTTDATKLALAGDTVYIADGKSGIKIIDISSERRPSRIGSLDTENAVDIVLQDSTLFIADGPGGFKIFDAAGSPNLKMISNFKCENAVALAVKNNIAYIADGSFGVRIVNISDINHPVEIAQIPMESITDILVNENYIFATDLVQGLSIYEVSDPLRPVFFDSVEMEDASSLTINNGIIYLTDKEGFKTVESFTTGRSFVIAEYKTDGKAYDLTYIDHTLYLADHRNGVRIVDVSNPTDSGSFFVKNKLDTSYAESVVGYGSKLLIADGEGGVALGEITYLEDGSQQVELQYSIDLPGITKSLVVYNDIAYIAAREEGMHILNLETKEIDTVFTGGSVQEIAVTKDLIFVADGVKGLKIYSNIDTPQLLSTVELSNTVTVAFSDGYVITGGKDGLFVIDISEPDKPVIVSSFNAGWIEDIHLEPGYIYAAAGYEGLIVLDMKNPADLVLVSACKDVYAVGVDVEKDLAFVADVDGFKVVKILIPSWLQ